MPNGEPNKIVLRYLRRLDERSERIENKQREMAADLRTVKGHMASFMQSETRQDETLASMEQRLDRVERRLDLVDTE